MPRFLWNDPSVRLTGRWSRLDRDDTDPHRFIHPTAAYTAATAPGSYLEIAFRGDMILLEFMTGYHTYPLPHLWLRLDGGADFEVPVDRFLRVRAGSQGQHVLRVLFKGAMEMQNRWYQPLAGAVCFAAYQAEDRGVLPEDHRPLIEFLGDSITEGVLIDTDYSDKPVCIEVQQERPYQDDNLATYASLLAAALDLRAMFQAYGAIGLTRSGCASVPRAGLIYPYVFNGVPYTGEKPDVIMINHGTNDRGATAEEFLMRYRELLDMLTEKNPGAKIICLTPFIGAFDADIMRMAEEYRREHNPRVYAISTRGWLAPEPLHPLRDGHRTAAEKLIPLVKQILAD